MVTSLEVTRSIHYRFEIRRTLRAAKDKKHLLSCLTTVHHCLFVRPHHSWSHGEMFEIYNPKMKEAICCDVGNWQY